MKWYRLIKEYPNGPKLGMLVKNDKDGTYLSASGMDNFMTSTSNVENYPEFWEKLPMFYRGNASSVLYNVQGWCYNSKEALCFYETASKHPIYLYSKCTKIAKQEYLESFGVKVGDKFDADLLNAWQEHDENYYHSESGWTKQHHPFVGERVAESLSIIEDKPAILISGTLNVYVKLEGFSKFAKEYKPKLTFGGHEVTIDGYQITCKGETDHYQQLLAVQRTILNQFKLLNKTSFGNKRLKSFSYDDDTHLCQFQRTYKIQDEDTVEIGCTTGTWKELCDIINHFEK